MAKATRLYEVPVPAAEGVKADAQIYLVEASSPSAAERHVGRKYIGDARLADGKRVAELMKAGAIHEVAEESAT